MFAYCRNNPVSRVDASGTFDYQCSTEDDDPFNDVGGGSYGSGRGAGGGGSSGGYSFGSVMRAVASSVELAWKMASGAGVNGLTVTSTLQFGGYPTAPRNVCFVAGTLIKAANGDIPIEEIQAGDYVWSWDEETGEVALKQVVETYVNKTSELIHIFVGGEEIITTPSHPFYSPVKGWTDAVHLRAGDILVLLNGEYVVVEKVQHEILETPITVYNFQVEDSHTYYVSGIGVLVHNSCNHSGAWNKERRSFWRKAGRNAILDKDYGAYIASEQNIARMRRGTAPIGWDGYSVQLHHWDGIANDFYNYSPVSKTLHDWLHYKGFE